MTGKTGDEALHKPLTDTERALARAMSSKRLLTDIEAAAMLGVSRSFVRRLVAGGQLKRVRLPSPSGDDNARLLRIDREDLELLIRQNKTRVA